ncbi:MAG: hypothetical protein II007_00370 [Gammaproteobacteria bacterium]|nr:hypothetical protein [Gammaproteobacteria bacterium]
MKDLHDLLEMESSELDFRFRKSSIEGKGTPQEVSDRRESVVKKLLEKYFPFPFRIAKGNVVDSKGNRSASIDCLVLNPEHPYTVSEDNNFSVILADGVDFAIEVKPDLSSKQEIERALRQIQSIKELTRAKSGSFGHTSSYQLKIPGIVFSNTTYSDLSLLLNTIVAYYAENKIKRSHQFDLIAINNRCLIINMRHGSYFYPTDPSSGEGLFCLNSKSQTLAALLFYINVLPLSTLRMDTAIITKYLNTDLFGNMVWDKEINMKLSSIEKENIPRT